MTAIAPKRVFISHASEDKYAFAKPMADYLRTEKGIDAWLDLYEVVGGDDIVEQIWEKGFETDCIVVLLSPDFLNKQWTMHELRTAVSKKVDDGFRVIPVVVKPCDIPSVLASTLRYQVGPNFTIIEIADKVAEAVYGVSMKPPLGSPPGHVTAVTLTAPGLNSSDVLILEAIFDNVMANRDNYVYTRDIRPIATANGIYETAMGECIEILIEKRLIKKEHLSAGSLIPESLSIPTHVVLSLAQAKGTDVERLRCQIASMIINDNETNAVAINERIACPRPLFIALLDDLIAQGFIRDSRYQGAGIRIETISAKFRRWFAEEC